MRGDARLRALERQAAQGDLDPRAALAARDRVRPPMLPVAVCDDIDGSGWGCVGPEWCQGWSGGPSWAGGNPPLPVAECVLPPWSRHRAAGMPSLARHGTPPDMVLRRELVTGARVLVPEDGRCAPCRGTGGPDESCEACGGWGWHPNHLGPQRPWIDPDNEAARFQPRGVTALAAVQGDLQRLDALQEAQAAAHEIASRPVRPVEEVAARLGVSVDTVLAWHLGRAP